MVIGLSQSAGMLIICRVFQGIGVGGLSALSQIVMAAMIAPRERGRYSGYLGATFAVATVGGPLLGGVITDTSWLGWRWCFYVGVPFAVLALVVLQKTLKLPVVKREVKVDWSGAFFITAAVSLLLIWVTFAYSKYEWASWQSYVMVGGSLVLGALFVLVESRAREPIIPLRLFRNRTITLASIASLFVGIGMFTGTVFFSQYFQLARDKSPTMSGLMTIPMIGGLALSSTVSGQVITRTGRWKAWLVSGGALLTAGLGLLGTIRVDTPYWHIAIYMALMGLGIGMMMQNLVLSTQNQVTAKDLGAASSTVTFFRSLGGAVGVSALGAVLGSRITHYVKDGLADLGPQGAALGHAGTGGGAIPDLSALPVPLRNVMESAYGHGVGDVFLFAAPHGAAGLPGDAVHQGGRAEDEGGRGGGGAGSRWGFGYGSGGGFRGGSGYGFAYNSGNRSGHGYGYGSGYGSGSGTAGHRRTRCRAGRRRHRGARRRRHPDLPGRQPVGPLGRRARRLLPPARAGLRLVRPDRLRRRLPAAGLHGGGR